MLDPRQIQEEIDRAKEAQRLGGYNRVCVICGQSNPRCLELHHLPERGYGDELVPLCRNCHRLVTDQRNNIPVPTEPTPLEKIAHWLLALAVFFFELAKRTLEYGELVLEASKVCPAPYGLAGVMP